MARQSNNLSLASYRKQHVPKEHDEQVALFRWAEANAGRIPPLRLLFAIPNAGGYSGGFRANVVRVKRMIAEGVKPGIPDTLLAWPAWHKNCAGLFLELKRVQGGTVSKQQKEMIAALREAGYAVEVCKGWEAARDAILSYLEVKA